MKAKPLRAHPAPHYPDKLSALRDPHLLMRHTPASWRRRPALAASAAFLLGLSTTNCVKVEKGPNDKRPAVVAPIFEHGDGRGSIGCVVQNPPVFLPEDEALSIIKEELARQGLIEAATNVEINRVRREGVRRQASKRDVPMTKVYTLDPAYYLDRWQVPVEADLDFIEPRLMIEYISVEDEKDITWYGMPEGWVALNIETKAVAESLSEEVRRHSKGIYFGAFYDPLVTYEAIHVSGASKSKQKLSESKDLLRAQVQDFVEWLKAQGAI